MTIARRFNGPPDSGNGGYSCGAFAVATGEDLRVRLHVPPPLDVPLTVETDATDATRWILRDGDRISIDAAAGTLNTLVSKNELLGRKPVAPARAVSGVLEKYAALVGPANLGAVTHGGATSTRKSRAR